MSTDNDVEFDIQFYPGILIKLINEKHDYNLNGIQKYLKLTVMDFNSAKLANINSKRFFGRFKNTPNTTLNTKNNKYPLQVLKN